MRGLVRRDPRGPETREMLRARGGATRFQPARERERLGRFREMARAERTSGEIEDGRQVDVDSGALEGLAGRPPGGERLLRALERRSGSPGRQLVEGARAPALLVDEDERAARARLASAPVLDDHSRDALGRGQARDHHESGLLPRRQRREIGRLVVAARDKSECGLEQRGETHAT